ncbi:MAG: oligosaccharyl transferase, archaeosortase A system-associated [Candidatus Methanoperedens sp.]|nr:oligosaccharyl transferase, archaeosortase A system-associated [Candidatus Methanoperedens sp.]
MKKKIKPELMKKYPPGFQLTGRKEIIALATLFLIAFAIRMLTYNSIFVGDNIRFLEFDTFYHMRRAVSFAENFPHVWDFDTFLNYPYGNIVGWPPLFDWTIALIAVILGSGHPGIHLIEIVGVFFPVFIGSLSAVVIYFICKEIFAQSDTDANARKIGLISAFFLSILPAFTQVSYLGFVDHHVAEVLLSLTLYLFFFKALRADNLKNRLIFSSLSGLVLALIVFTWLGSPIFIGIILIYTLFQNIIDKKNNRDPPVYLEDSGLVVFTSALFFSIVIYFSYKAPSLLITSGEISFFHFGLLLISIVILVIFRLLFRTIRSWNRYLLTLVGMLLIIYAVIYFFLPETYGNLYSGIDYLTTQQTVLQQVKEAQPLFLTSSGKVTLEPAWYAFNTALYIGIAGITLFFYRIINKSLILNPTKLMFLVWTFVFLILNLYQTRFIYHFVIHLSILSAFLITEFTNSNRRHIKIISIVLFIAILIPSMQTNSLMIQNPLMLSDDWFSSLGWLKNNTPEVSSGYQGSWSFPVKDQIPDYGVMAWWDYGNYILYLAKRPVVANNFQLGAEDSAKFLTSENESEANIIMDKRKARYVIVDYRSGMNVVRSNGRTSIRGSFVSATILLGKDIRYYLDKNNFPNEKYLNTTYARLYLFNGKGLNNYKLIYKSQTRYPDLFNRPIEEIKIFEYKGV